MIFPSERFFPDDVKKIIGQTFLNELTKFFVSTYAPNFVAVENQTIEESLALAFGAYFIECISRRPIATYLTENNRSDFINQAALSTGVEDVSQLSQTSFWQFLEKGAEIDSNTFNSIISLFLKDEMSAINRSLMEGESNTNLQNISNTKIVEILQQTLPHAFDWTSANSSFSGFFKAVIQNIKFKPTEAFVSTSELTAEAILLEKKLEIDQNDFSNLTAEEKQDLISLLNLSAPYIDLETIDHTSSLSPPQSPTQPKTILQKLEPIIESMATPYTQKEKEISKNASETEGYVITHTMPDGDCGYSCFERTRIDAYNSIVNKLDDAQIQLFLKKILDELFIEDNQRKAFFDYLVSKKILSTNITFEAFSTNSDAYKNDEAILRAYLKFDIVDKKIDDGWAHPLILHAMARVNNINLNLWEANSTDDQLQQLPQYSTYLASSPQARTLNLLFHSASGKTEDPHNHFSPINIIGGGSYPLRRPTPEMDLNLAMLMQNYRTALCVLYHFLGKAETIQDKFYTVESIMSHVNDLRILVTANFPQLERLNSCLGGFVYLEKASKSQLFKEWLEEKNAYIAAHITPELTEHSSTSESLLKIIPIFFSGENRADAEKFFLDFKKILNSLLKNLAEKVSLYHESTVNLKEEKMSLMQKIRQYNKEKNNVDYNWADELRKDLKNFLKKNYRDQLSTLSEEISGELTLIKNQITGFYNSEFKEFLKILPEENRPKYTAIINAFQQFLSVFDDILSLHTQEIQNGLPDIITLLQQGYNTINKDLQDALLNAHEEKRQGRKTLGR